MGIMTVNVGLTIIHSQLTNHAPGCDLQPVEWPAELTTSKI